MTEKSNIGVIVLAAGSSSRLGRPKQLVRFNGKTLLQHALDMVNISEFGTSVLVTGANDEEVLADLDTYSFIRSHNPDWKEGMASSIRSGLKVLTGSDPEIDAVLIMLSDQPFVSSGLLNKLRTAFKQTNDLVVSEYQETIGVPAIIGRDYFTELNNLRGDTGAKKIMMKHSDKLRKVSFEKGNIDIDTESDIDLLNQIES